jgi:hypothetical protein
MHELRPQVQREELGFEILLGPISAREFHNQELDTPNHVCELGIGKASHIPRHGDEPGFELFG